MSLEIKRINNALIILVVSALLVAGVMKGFVLASPYVVFAIPAVFFGMILISKPEFFWCFLVMISSSNLAVGNMTLFAMLAFVFSGTGLVRLLMQKSDRTPMQAPHRFLLGLLLVSIFTGMVRGLGFRFLGSSSWGGNQYLILWGVLGFCLMSNKIRISEKNLIRAIIIMLIIAVFPGVLRYANEVLGGRLNGLGRVIRGVALEISETAVDQEAKRLEGVQSSGGALILLSMVLMFWKRASALKLIALGGAGLALLGLAGYRSALMSALLTVFFYYLIMRKEIPHGIRRKVIVCGLVSVISLPFLLPYLPFGFQRMFAWIPGINISREAYLSSQGTTDWRIEMWKMMLPMVKEFLIVGRGLSFHLDNAYQAYISTSDIQMRHQFFIATHQYHNGPLYLLVDYGALGFVCGTGFMISAIIRHVRFARQKWSAIWLRNLHSIYLARLIAGTLMFYFVYGALNSFSWILVDVTILEMIVKVAATKKQVAESGDISGSCSVS